MVEGARTEARARLDASVPLKHPFPMSERIVIDPEVCGGRPIVAGTRMRVIDVLDALAAGATVDELVADFPYLSREDVSACLAYAARSLDHRVVHAA
jgi:uncharacterized protein (DUF433 family)